MTDVLVYLTRPDSARGLQGTAALDLPNSYHQALYSQNLGCGIKETKRNYMMLLEEIDPWAIVANNFLISTEKY